MQSNGGVRINNLPRIVIGPAQGIGHVAGIRAGGCEQGSRPFALRIGELHRAALFKTRHLFSHSCAIAPANVEQKPLKIGTDLNIHAGRCGWRDRAG